MTALPRQGATRKPAPQTPAPEVLRPLCPAPPALFRLRGLGKDYPSPAGPVRVLSQVHLAIEKGLTALLGESGAGKTTLLSILGGLTAPSAGQVCFRGEPIDFGNEERMRSFRAHQVAWVFQDLNLVGHLTALDNVALPLELQGTGKRRARAEARQRLAQVGLAGLAGRWPHQLSRGQKQRVAIARALASRAEVILADEPTGSLDCRLAESIMTLFRGLARQAGKLIVLVTHSPQLAREHCDRILLCAGGRVEQQWQRGKARITQLAGPLQDT